MLDPKINTFLVLCETMNYTRAAERLCLTQPAVTHHIQRLQEHYGVKLFTYEGKVLKLTSAGAKLRDCARSMELNSVKIKEMLTEPGRIKVRAGASKTIGEYLLAERIAKLLNERPDADFSLMVENTQILLSELDNGRLDFAIVEGHFDRSRYSSRLWHREEFRGVCHPDHPFARREVDMGEILGERLIIREEGSGTRAVFEDALRRRGFALPDFSQTAVINDFSTIKALVKAGMGISFLYDPVVEKEVAGGSLSRFSISGSPMDGLFRFVWLKDSLFAEEWIGMFES